MIVKGYGLILKLITLEFYGWIQFRSANSSLTWNKLNLVALRGEWRERTSPTFIRIIGIEHIVVLFAMIRTTVGIMVYNAAFYCWPIEWSTPLIQWRTKYPWSLSFTPNTTILAESCISPHSTILVESWTCLFPCFVLQLYYGMYRWVNNWRELWKE